MTALVLGFADVGHDDLALVGGKGANLGELARAGLPVPPGFCITTNAYRQALHGAGGAASRLEELLERLVVVPSHDMEAACAIAADIRDHITAQPVPDSITHAIVSAWERCGSALAYAVRSSATAEDLPHASFAGQQDTYLNVFGRDALLDHVRQCWASLFTDRAVLYRVKQGIAHGDVALCVVVQKMVSSEKAGILFTADPMSGHRGVATIDAGWGLGESLVSGRVSADLYRVDRESGTILEIRLGDKTLAIRSTTGGGTHDEILDDERRHARVLDDSEITALIEMGNRIHTLRGGPQDIEWCVEAGKLHVVQARPITSLYPLARPAPSDTSLHAYFCANHFQVMTDAMPPMALHVWRLMMPFGKRPGQVGVSPLMHRAGGRLFIDLSPGLRHRVLRRVILRGLAGVDALATAMIRTIVEKPAFQAGPKVRLRTLVRLGLPRLLALLSWLGFRRTSGAALRMSAWLHGQIAAAREQIVSDASLVERVRAARAVSCTFIWPLLRLPPVVLAGAVAGALVRKLTGREASELAALGQGLDGNMTTEMDLAIGDLADCARAHPRVRERLMTGDATLEELGELPGGDEFAHRLGLLLQRYGQRGPSEIDVSRKRWREEPGSILATLAGNLAHSQDGEHRRHHAALAEKAGRLASELIGEARRGWFGFIRAALVARFIRVHRDLLALREHPKFALVGMLDAVRTTALEAGAQLVADGRLVEADDVFMLSFDELERALSDGEWQLAPLVSERRAKFAHYQSLYPPRVMTSQGEIPSAEHDRDGVPENALAGSPASAGVVEGLARVITDPARQVLHKGEILVAPFTDPGWTPLFLNAAGLVMEVGGLMTHGSVVAREYGIPAVVCVPQATLLIRTGQRVRLHGDAGYVEILEDVP